MKILAREDNGIVRPAILIEKGETTSIDVVDERGCPLYRLNIGLYEHTRAANVDVIGLQPSADVRVKAFREGRHVLFYLTRDHHVVSVETAITEE